MVSARQMDVIIEVDLILFDFLQFNCLFHFIENISMEYKRKNARTQMLMQTNTIYQSDEVTIAE